MRTVKLTSGKVAIPLITKTFITRKRMIDILVDLAFNEKIDLGVASKSEAIKAIREHIFFQGITTYCDWYEDTDATPKINKLYPLTRAFVSAKFPELKP